MELVHSSSVSIYKGYLRLKIKIDQVEEQLEYFFYLYHNNILIEKKKDMTQPECNFPLYEDGNYFVRYIIKNSFGEDVMGESEKIQFNSTAEVYAQYRINYLGNSKILDYLDVRKYLNIEKILDNNLIKDMSEEEMLSFCKILTDNNPDSIIIDLIDEKDKYDISIISEEIEKQIYTQWMKFVKILREFNQVRVILINRKFYTDEEENKYLYDQLNYLYEILYYPFYKYYHKLSKIMIESKLIEQSSGELDELIKLPNIGKKHLMKELKWKDSPKFNIYTTRINDTIYIEVKTNSMAEQVQYMFSLYKDKVLYEKGFWASENNKDWTLHENGIYFVQVSVRNAAGSSTKHSKTFTFFDQTFKQEYQQFLDKVIIPSEMDHPLEYFKAEYPYNDFGLVTIKNDVKLENSIEKLQNFIKTTMEQEVSILPNLGEYQSYLISDIKPLEKNEKQIILSGDCIINDHFLCGTSDAKYIDVFEQLCETTGQFSAVVIGKEDITVTTDFFNISRVYYYEDANYFIITNRYHMLVLLCRYLGIVLKLDYKQVGSLLSSGDIGYGRQNFTYDMNIIGLKEVRSGFYWKLTKNGWQQFQNGLYEICNTKEIYHEKKYKDLIISAKKEMLHDLDVLLSDNRIKEVLVDLSGGLDTRAVYAAVTNMTKNKEKIYIHAGASDKNQDIKVATAINELYHFPYDNIPISLRYHSMRSIINKMRSTDIGTYYGRQIRQTVQTPIIVKLIGSGAESVVRPYYVRNMYDTKFEYEYNIDDFLDTLESLVIPKINTDYDMAYSESRKILEKELLQFPYEEVIEKYNYYYLAFGGVYHCHSIIDSYLGSKMYMILLSKQLLNISSITESVFKSPKLEMDFIAECNPVLGVMNYESKSYNDTRDAIKNLYYSNPSLSGAVTLHTMEDMMDWKVAAAEKKANIQVSSEQDATYYEGEAIQTAVYNSSLYKLQQLMRQSNDLNNMLGIALYYYLTYSKKNYGHILQYYHKLTSVLDQLNIIQS